PYDLTTKRNKHGKMEHERGTNEPYKEDSLDENATDDDEDIDNQEINAVDANEPLVVAEDVPPRPQAPIPPAPLFTEAIDAPGNGGPSFPFAGEEQGEEERAANEDLEGVLEAIGMRGSPWMLFQNSALMAVLITLCLAGAIWIPYIVGKSVLLVNPFKLIELPLS
ncbi:2079_t:CDS:2, partial [Paraglomus occultum]